MNRPNLAYNRKVLRLLNMLKGEFVQNFDSHNFFTQNLGENPIKSLKMKNTLKNKQDAR